MKKLLLIITAFCLFLCGCKNETEIKPYLENINFTVHSIFGNTEYILNGFCSEDGRVELSVQSPAEMENIKFCLVEDTVKIYYLDLEKEIPLKNFEENSVLKIVFTGFIEAFKCDSLYFEDNNYIMDFEVDAIDYRMYYSQSGLPLKISSQNENTEIIFEGMSV